MFPFPIAKPQGCDIQTFYGTNSSNKLQKFSWNKPVGVSHVYMLLIGAGGNGDTTSLGGGSGSVTTWYGAAQHVPNNLIVEPGIGDASANTTIFFASRSSTLITLIDTLSATTSTGGPATIPEAFAASGFFNSVAGQNGSSTNISASTTTFLSGGAQAATNDVVANYGYSVTHTNPQGFFLMQPIIVGVGGSGTGRGGIGCGGGVDGKGGPGMVLIASW